MVVTNGTLANGNGIKQTDLRSHYNDGAATTGGLTITWWMTF